MHGSQDEYRHDRDGTVIARCKEQIEIPRQRRVRIARRIGFRQPAARCEAATRNERRHDGMTHERHQRRVIRGEASP